MTEYTIRFQTTVEIEDEDGDIVESWDSEQTVSVDEAIEFGYSERGYGGDD